MSTTNKYKQQLDLLTEGLITIFRILLSNPFEMKPSDQQKMKEIAEKLDIPLFS